jgi:broad specificity phosphatase PhoE
MAERLRQGLQRHEISRIISSPQRRALQTAAPLALHRGIHVEVDERLAEYDHGLNEYVPVEELAIEDPHRLARLRNGELPDGVDVDVFKARVREAADQISSEASPNDTVAVFSHGGVISVLLHQALETPKVFPFTINYVSVSHLRLSASGKAYVLGINNIEHVWDLLPNSTDTR